MISKVIFLLFSLVRVSLSQQLVPAVAPTPTIIAPITRPTIIAPNVIQPSIIAPTPTIVAPITRPTIIAPNIMQPIIIAPNVLPSIITRPPTTRPPFTRPPTTRPPTTRPPFTRPPSTRPPTIPPELDNSHLTCFRGNIAKSDRFNATIALKANMWQEEYSVNKCKVNTRKVDLCVPSTKKILATNTTFPTIIEQYPPQMLKNDFLCYFMKCEETTKVPDGQVAVDQFGRKGMKILKNKTMKVCVPAWKLDKEGKPIMVGVPMG